MTTVLSYKSAITKIVFIYFFMVRTIDIEYCGGWGYGGPANRVKAAIASAFPDAQISCHSAGSMTRLIEVAWVEDGKKKIIWSKGKADTDNEKGYGEIIALLKSNWWSR